MWNPSQFNASPAEGVVESVSLEKFLS